MGLEKAFGLIMIVLAVTYTHATAEDHAITDREDFGKEHLRFVLGELQSLKRDKLIMKDMIKKQRKEMMRLHETLAETRSEMVEMKQSVMKEVSTLTRDVARLTGNTALEPVKYMRSAFGCTSEEIHLACSDGKTIMVTSADYGEYSQPCGEGECCLPNPIDCTELLSVNDDADWIDLKVTCDNKTECSYLFQGSTFVQDCTVLGPVSYMNVYYNCLPEDSDSPVAFSAYASNERQYIDNDIIMFDAVITNLGGNYQSTGSTFLCPVHGVYVFAVTIVNEPGYAIDASLRKETSRVSGSFSTSIEGERITGSTVAVIECPQGEKVWVQSQSNATMNGGSYRHSVFTGFLLHRYT